MPDLDDLLGRAKAWAEPQYLAEREARVAALAEGAELEDADLWPLMLLIDDERRQVPNIVRNRVHAQRSHYIEGFSLAEIEASVLVPEWQKRRFRTFGFILIALPMPALVTLPRGRRQLEAVEARLFEALRVWGFALRPALRLLVERAPSLARASASEVDYLAAHAPDLMAIAATPHRRAESAAAKAQDPGSVEPHDVLRDFLDQLGREGRRLRVRFATEGSDQPFFGDALADRMLARIEAQLPPGVPEAATGWRRSARGCSTRWPRAGASHRRRSRIVPSACGPTRKGWTAWAICRCMRCSARRSSMASDCMRRPVGCIAPSLPSPWCSRPQYPRPTG